MADEFKNEDTKKDKKTKRQYLIINKNNYPYDLHIGNTMYRLEPRNKEGDNILISEVERNHKDMETVENKVIIQEVIK